MTDSGTIGVGTSLREFIVGDQKLPVGVEHVGQIDRTTEIGGLRGISSARECADFDLQFTSLRFVLPLMKKITAPDPPTADAH